MLELAWQQAKHTCWMMSLVSSSAVLLIEFEYKAKTCCIFVMFACVGLLAELAFMELLALCQFLLDNS